MINENLSIARQKLVALAIKNANPEDIDRIFEAIVSFQKEVAIDTGIDLMNSTAINVETA